MMRRAEILAFNCEVGKNIVAPTKYDSRSMYVRRNGYAICITQYKRKYVAVFRNRRTEKGGNKIK